MTDPLAFEIQTQGVDTSYPLIPEGDYPLQISGAEFKPSRFDDSVLTWEPQLVTTAPITAVDGRPVPPNSRVFLQYPIGLKEEKEPKYPGTWLTTLINTVDAIFGFDKDSRPNVNRELLDSAVGKTVIGTIVIDEDKQGVKRNKVKRLKTQK